jgi:hypothetical protein
MPFWGAMRRRAQTVDAGTVKPLHDRDRLLDDLSKEYYAIFDIVSGFDQRLMTVKGWSVTLSLAGLGLGFQQGHYALFALAARTGLAFWYVDTLTKRHQMKYYPRMRDIEVAALQLNNVKIDDGRVISAPRVDWTWGARHEPDWRDKPPLPRTQANIDRMLRRAPWMANVALPHVVAVIVGFALFIAARRCPRNGRVGTLRCRAPDEVVREVVANEMKLLVPAVRRSRLKLEQLLHPSYVEFGASAADGTQRDTHDAPHLAHQRAGAHLGIGDPLASASRRRGTPHLRFRAAR